MIETAIERSLCCGAEMTRPKPDARWQCSRCGGRYPATASEVKR